MDSIELLDLVGTGETSKVQFKVALPSRERIIKEMVAKSNALGGVILFGIEDVTGKIVGLSPEDLEAADKVLAECADTLKPPIYIRTEVVRIDVDETQKNVLVAHVDEGINKPYKTTQGEIYTMQGSNKRRVTDNAEIMRLFQQSRNLLADEMEVSGTAISDIDEKLFSNYFQKEFGEAFEERGLTFEQALAAKRVIRNGSLSLAGLLYFGKSPQSFKPAFTIKAVSFFGNDESENQYRSKPTDFQGTIPELYEQAMAFVRSNLDAVQSGDSFNSKGNLEISPIALEELVLNSLVHRDYFKNAPIRLMIFDNRIEILSPGKLPNSLTVDDIKYGNPIVRNNQLVAFSQYAMPYSGLGTGIRRALKAEPEIELVNNIDGDQFEVKIPRKGK